MADLILRLAAPDGEQTDVIADIDADHTTGELIGALARFVGTPVMSATVDRTGFVIHTAADPVSGVELVSGDLLRLGDESGVAGRSATPARAVTADVLAGPDSGSARVLAPGRHRVGRGADCDVVIDDRSVSRHHLDLDVDAGLSVTAIPAPETANGVTLNDEVIETSHVVTPDDVIGLGGTRLAVRPFERAADERVDRLGQIDFHRTPYRPPVVEERADVELGPIPDRPDPRRFQALAMLAPLVGGLVLFAFMRQPQFLALMAISPLMMVATVIEDRRTGRRTLSDDLAAFEASLDGHREHLERLRHAERLERLRTAPDLADLARRAELRTVHLWARGRDAPDFLRLRLGLGTTPVSYGIGLERGGADDLRAELLAAVEGLDRIDHVPITVDLTTDPVVGVHGERSLVDGVAASIVVQAATLHSPEDLTIAAAIGRDRPFGWLKWLPHTRSVASPLPGEHVVHEAADATGVVSRLVEVADFRAGGVERDDERRVWPRLLVVIDADLAPDPSEVSRLLEVGPDVGISVVWLAASLARVPRQASRVLDVEQAGGAAMVGRLWSTDPEVADQALEVEHLRADRADRVARSLAPIRDASTASQATSIPRTAPLLDVLGVGHPTPDWISEQWLGSTDYDLRFPIGFAADGPLEIDLVADGPHSLIGGTSGAGKSELLQSMVAALAVRHAPTRLNFLFVDYKGGASSKVFERLPHTVGYVTNLSADLSIRALVSLRAELDRRMRVMEGVAKDLEEMLEVAPQDAPPSLVIIVDEFATLVKEVPEFVAGVVDIAQRGRSLGIHLVLATQRPSGSVNENILANTNLRMSLRMLDRAESTSVIGSPEAADIPVPLRGRGFVRLGPRQLVEFQSSFAGAPVVTGEVRTPVFVAPFDRTTASPRPTGGGSSGNDDGATHLSVLLDAMEEANRVLALPAARRPWREVLDEQLTLDGVLAERDRRAEEEIAPGRHVTFGMLDAPEAQDQRPISIDLEEGGGWLVFGSGGSGKTTLLRTVATSLALDAEPGDVAVLGLDFASRGLASIRSLPDVVDVATGDDLEAVTRHLTVVDAELTRRRHLLGEADAESLTAYHRDHDRLPRIVVLIDGFGGLASTFIAGAGSASAAMEQWGDIVQRLVIDGRQVGIHTIITADRSNAVPSRIQSAVSNRLILRHADVAAYAEHGIGTERARDLDLPPGRGLLRGQLVQVAVVAADHSARGQGDGIASAAGGIDRPSTTVLSTTRLPDSVPSQPCADRLTVAIGVADVTGEPVNVGIEHAGLVVCGGPRSGRSTALATVVESLAGAHDVVVVGPSASPLGRLDLDGVEVVTGRPDALVEPLERFANRLAMGAGDQPAVLVVDDADLLDDFALNPVLERLVAIDGLTTVASIETRSMGGFTQSPLLTVLRRSRRLLVLRPDDPSEFLTTTGVKLSMRPGIDLPPGRGVLLVDRIPTIVQVSEPAGTSA